MRIYCGRSFSLEDIQTIKDLMAQDPSLKRYPLSRKLCELWSWKRLNGGLKDMTCRVALARMQADGLITLPASRNGVVRRRAQFNPTQASDPQTFITAAVHELAAITISPVKGTASSRLWNEYVARYHYLGYTPMSGAQIRYNVYAGEQLVACISFGASAWKLKDRERFIGWQEHERKKNLQLVVNNARLPDPALGPQQGLGIEDLGAVRASTPPRLAAPLRLCAGTARTFVETQRHRGTCYKAANWINIGQTTGRGKKSKSHQQLIPVKDIWMYPLRKNFAAVLCR